MHGMGCSFFFLEKEVKRFLLLFKYLGKYLDLCLFMGGILKEKLRSKNLPFFLGRYRGRDLVV